MNPYASYLGDRDPLAVIKKTPQQLRGLLDSMGRDGAEHPPAPGKWNAREILCHLADTELVFAFRLRQALAEDHHVIQPFDQDKWAVVYKNFTAEQALDVFSSVRKWNVTFIESTPKEAFSKKLTHPERGEMTFQVVVETMGGHDINHLGQLDAIRDPHRK